jgi:hypothetical protein
VSVQQQQQQQLMLPLNVQNTSLLAAAVHLFRLPMLLSYPAAAAAAVRAAAAAAAAALWCR